MNVPAGLILKVDRAISVLRAHRDVVVALSGGVDSATLLAVACEAVGPGNVLAVTGRSSSVAEPEIEDARNVAQHLGVSHAVVETHEMDRDGYRQNTGDRCFHCRTELFEVLSAVSTRRGVGAIAYGAIVDDLRDDRPGMRAARDMGILAPLLEAGICKTEVRILARQFNLHIHDKPSNACLASRMPIGFEVTAERLNQVDRAETALREMGFRRYRVRHHAEIARIELGGEDANRLGDPNVRSAIVSAVKAAGFKYVAVDLEGYDEGRLHSIAPARDGGQ